MNTWASESITADLTQLPPFLKLIDLFLWLPKLHHFIVPFFSLLHFSSRFQTVIITALLLVLTTGAHAWRHATLRSKLNSPLFSGAQ